MSSKTMALIVLVSAISCVSPPASAQSSANALPPAKFASPPTAETAAVARHIDECEALVKAGSSASELLSNTKFDSVRAWPRFRAAIRQASQAEPLTLVSPTEAGVPLVVRGRLVDASGAGVSGALIYVFHTDARGLYAENAIHVGGDSGDWKHARLFGYLRAGKGGEFELRTVRPAGYPGSELPQHIHVGVEHAGARLTTEIGFEDDPRLTPAGRSRFVSQGNFVARVTRNTDGAQTATVDIMMR